MAETSLCVSINQNRCTDIPLLLRGIFDNLSGNAIILDLPIRIKCKMAVKLSRLSPISVVDTELDYTMSKRFTYSCGYPVYCLYGASRADLISALAVVKLSSFMKPANEIDQLQAIVKQHDPRKDSFVYTTAGRLIFPARRKLVLEIIQILLSDNFDETGLPTPSTFEKIASRIHVTLTK